MDAKPLDIDRDALRRRAREVCTPCWFDEDGKCGPRCHGDPCPCTHGSATPPEPTDD